MGCQNNGRQNKGRHLKAGDKLDFDETALFLKASKVIEEKDWDAFGNTWKDPWPEQSALEVVEMLRGDAE